MTLRPARLLLLVLATACTDGTDADPADTDATDSDTLVDPLAFAVDAPGPYQVGYRSLELTYDPPADTASRTVGMYVWYPTLDTEGEVGRYGVYAEATGTLLDATPAPDDALTEAHGGRPLLVHSHGDQAFGGDNAPLFGHLAQHGWVIVSVDHVDNLLFANVQPTPPLHWVHRPSDLAYAVDQLEALPSDDPLSGLVRTDRYLVSGHSRGATTVWSILGAQFAAGNESDWCPGCTSDQASEVATTPLKDSRARAGLLLDGGVRGSLFGDDGAPEVTAPILWMTAGETGAGGSTTWDAMASNDAVWMAIADACHLSFTSGTCGTLDAQVGFDRIFPPVLAWARTTLLDDASVSGWIDGSVAQEGVTVTTR